MELIERIPLTPIQYLNSITFSQFKDLETKRAESKGKKKPPTDDIKTKFTLLQKFCTATLKTKGVTTRIYSHSMHTPAGEGGRLFCGNSLQNVPIWARGLIIRDTMTDLDMANAHPVILRYICRKHNIPCPELDNYVMRREDVLKQFSSRANGKHLFLVATNTDETLKGKHPAVLKRYCEEMRLIQSALIHRDEYKALFDSMDEYKKAHNYNGCAVNKILCYFENIILGHAIHILNKNNLEVGVLMFDGCAIYGNHYDHPTLLQEITDYVNAKMEGLDMQWTFKEHDDTMQIPDDFDPETANPKTKTFETDLDAGEYLYEQMKSGIVYSLGELYYRRDNHQWTTNDKEISKTLRLKVQQADLRKPPLNPEKSNFCARFSAHLHHAKDITETIKSIAMQNADNNFANTIIKSCAGYSLFTNGYYNWEEGVFTPLGSPDWNYSIIFMEMAPYEFKFKHELNEAELKAHDKLVFGLYTEPFGLQVGNYYRLNVARGLAGNPFKRIIFCIGDGNNGKSVMGKAIKRVGGSYAGTFNALNLAEKKGITDEAQNLRWLLLSRYKRIITSSEMKMGTPLDSATIKMLTNGGEDQSTGRNHGGDEMEFKHSILPFVFANDIPQILPMDKALRTRIKAIPHTKTYVEKVEFPDLELQIDPTFSSFVDSAIFPVAFMASLAESYTEYVKRGHAELQPNDIVEAVEANLLGQEDIITIFQSEFKITNIPDDFLKNSDISKWMTDTKKTDCSLAKLTRNIATLVAKNTGTMSKVAKGKKKIGGSCERGWVGIRKFTADELEEKEGGEPDDSFIETGGKNMIF